MHLPEAEVFIKRNWLLLNDKQIARRLFCSEYAVTKIRKSMNLIKEQPSFLTNYSDRKKVAKLIEGFFNGKTIRQSANDADINPVTACRLIKENALYKQRSYDTVTLVIYSKINFDEESI